MEATGDNILGLNPIQLNADEFSIYWDRITYKLPNQHQHGAMWRVKAGIGFILHEIWFDNELNMTKWMFWIGQELFSFMHNGANFYTYDATCIVKELRGGDPQVLTIPIREQLQAAIQKLKGQ